MATYPAATYCCIAFYKHIWQQLVDAAAWQPELVGASCLPYLLTLLCAGALAQEYQPPSGALEQAIDAQFGALEGLVKAFNAKAAAVQGSGWGWLAYHPEAKTLVVATSANQDPLNPTTGLIPLLGIDVWVRGRPAVVGNLRLVLALLACWLAGNAVHLLGVWFAQTVQFAQARPALLCADQTEDSRSPPRRSSHLLNLSPSPPRSTPITWTTRTPGQLTSKRCGG